MVYICNVFFIAFGCGINSKVDDTAIHEELSDTADTSLEETIEVEETGESPIEETAEPVSEPVSEPGLSDHEYDGGIEYEDIDLSLLELDIHNVCLAY